MQRSIDSRWRIVRFAGESNSSEPNDDVLAIEGARVLSLKFKA